MPFVAVIFLGYALFGEALPPPWTHRNYEVDRLVGQLYITLEGIFGPSIDVSSSLIILFTIFGAVLQASGAGKFFIDFSFNMMGGKPTSAGRAVTFASFLLGGPSGSGVARSEEPTSELQSLMRILYAVFCLKKKQYRQIIQNIIHIQNR